MHKKGIFIRVIQYERTMLVGLQTQAWEYYSRAERENTDIALRCKNASPKLKAFYKVACCLS